MLSTLTEAPADITVQRARVDQLLGWFDERPCRTVTGTDDLVPIIEHATGRTIDPNQLVKAYIARLTRDKYLGTPEQCTTNQTAYEATLDQLLDITRCEACRNVIADDSSRDECSGHSFCEWQCHQQFHNGSRCGEI